LNMVTAVRSITTYLQNTADDKILNCLPLSFDYGLYQILMAAAFGGTVVQESHFAYPARIVNLLTQENITGFPIVPAMSAMLQNLQSIKECAFPHVSYITNTGQALPQSHIRWLQEVFPRARIYSMYGLTECKRTLFLPPEEINLRPGSVGKAIPNTEVWLVDESGDRINRPFTEGELVVRGATIMQGYWNKPEATARILKEGPFSGERCLYTGDIFYYDEDGYLYFVSRRDSQIKRGGERISPREIELVIEQIPGVIEAAVIPVADEILGNELKALITLEKGMTVTTGDISRTCKRELESFKVPRYIEIRDRLPKSSNGKIDKKALIQKSDH